MVSGVSSLDLMIRRLTQTKEFGIYPQIIPLTNGFILIHSDGHIMAGKDSKECIQIIKDLRSGSNKS